MTMTTSPRCAQCRGLLIGDELAFATCGDCGHRWAIDGRPLGQYFASLDVLASPAVEAIELELQLEAAE
jgi:hypothetical protein